MAPVTRARRRKDSIPLVPVLGDPNSSHPAAKPSLPQLQVIITPASKLRKQNPTVEGTGEHTNGTANQPPSSPPPEGGEPTNFTVADSESDSGSDDEAPEAVSLDTGREVARKAQDEAKRAAEAQADAARKKRKARDAKLKEQKEEANERKAKRRKVSPEDEEENAVDNSKALSIAEKSTEPLADGVDVENSSPLPTSPPPPVEKSLTEPKPPALLPETLLAQVAATKRRRHREQSDPPPDPEPEQTNQVTNTGIGGHNADRNRRKRQRQKLNRTIKKGPVSVKVLKDDTKSRKILPPPAAKVVGSIKNSWLYGRKAGGAMRRDVITGFVRK